MDRRYTTSVPVATLVPLSEYLSQAYHPDCDYLEGTLQERNVGEIAHSDAQSACLVYVRTHYPDFWAGVEVRVQIKANRFRVPDVIIVRGTRPAGRIMTTPPLVSVQVLSPEDRAGDLQSRLDDYFGFGVSTVWVLNPETKRGFIHTADGSHEARDGILRTPSCPDLTVPLAAIFPAGASVTDAGRP